MKSIITRTQQQLKNFPRDFIPTKSFVIGQVKELKPPTTSMFENVMMCNRGI